MDQNTKYLLRDLLIVIPIVLAVLCLFIAIFGVIALLAYWSPLFLMCMVPVGIIVTVLLAILPTPWKDD